MMERRPRSAQAELPGEIESLAHSLALASRRK